MFRLIRYAFLGVLAFLVATWISESRGDIPVPLDKTTTPQFAGETS